MDKKERLNVLNKLTQENKTKELAIKIGQDKNLTDIKDAEEYSERVFQKLLDTILPED